ncbi:MAG: ATP-binding protein [bacterium]|nr:ATP-binding protein [bacterium]
MIFGSYSDLLVLGLAISGIGMLGFLVFFNNPRSATNQTFLAFSLISIVWGVLNYASYQAQTTVVSLWLWRSVLFTAVWFCFGIFHLATIFPQEKPKLGHVYSFFILPTIIISSLVTLTPYVFVQLKTLPIPGTVPAIQNGPLILLFGVVVIALVLGAIYKFLHHLRSAEGDLRKQYLLITFGTFLTFALLIICNFILPAGFRILSLIPFGAVFILPFIICTGYAIARYRLFSTRVVVTETFSFILVITTLLQVLFSKTPEELLFRVSAFVLVLVFSILLVRGTVNEMQQRELIEKQEKELEGANVRLRELDKQKSEFLSFASHQLRTPMTAIKWGSGALLDHTYGEVPTNLQEPIQSIFDQSSSMAVLVDDYLNVSRIEQGKMQYTFAPIDLSVLLKTVASQMEPGLRAKGLALETDLGEGRTMVWGDSGKLAQVFGNIIDNAIKYTQQGSIHVSLRKLPERGVAHIEVLDTGIGMDEATLHKIFEKFIRGDNAAEVSTTGSGLGLFIVKTFVEAHKGKVWPESQGLGKGNTFYVELPLLIQK